MKIIVIQTLQEAAYFRYIGLYSLTAATYLQLAINYILHGRHHSEIYKTAAGRILVIRGSDGCEMCFNESGSR
jgi:hypothetical protein